MSQIENSGTAIKIFKIEGGWLDWVRRNQTTIRADKYNGLIDPLNNDDLPNAGKRIILPPSIYGSPRFYSEKFQDAMCLVRTLTRPDLFITLTCNFGTRITSI